jgi:hypothetical protein
MGLPSLRVPQSDPPHGRLHAMIPDSLSTFVISADDLSILRPQRKKLHALPPTVHYQ